jgi:acyl-CoA synthetase (AMP-forming)/AMP-acid ligase II
MDSCWVAGATLVILPGPDPRATIQAIAEQRITLLLVVPTLLGMLLDHPDAAAADFSSLRVVLYAAAPAAASLVRRALERLGPVLYTGFGQTEAYGLNTFLSPEEHVAALQAGDQRLSSVGRECTTFSQVCLRSDTGEEVSTGEADRDGYIFLADRKEDKIITGGFNVYPAEVEAELAEHPALAECAVFAVPDPKWGEAIRAAVTLRPGASATPEELKEFCKERLAAFKVPKAFDVVEALPRTPVGKVLRRALRAPFWEGRQRDVHGAQ